MATAEKKILLFIKGPSQNLKAVESFLSRRNFTVHSETDIKEALGKAVEIQPDYIFLAWDHPNPKAHNLPRLILQACNSIVVPFITATTKEAMRKLNICPMNPKLYPPVSGPAIERLVLKSVKANTEVESRTTHLRPTKLESREEMVKIRSNLMANLESENAEVFIEKGEDKSSPQSRFRSESIGKRNDILGRSKKLNLSQKSIDELKNSFQEKVKVPLENLITTLNESEKFSEVNVMPGEERASGQLIIQKGIGPGTDFGTVIPTGEDPQKIGTVIATGEAPEKIGTVIQKGSGAGGDFGTVFPEENGTEKTGHVIHRESLDERPMKLRPERHVYCMQIFSENWCGYLILVTGTALEFPAIDMIFTDWIQLQFENLQELEEDDFFELRPSEFTMLDYLTKKADYHEDVKIHDYDLSISFFSVSPDRMTVHLSEDHDYIQVRTDDVPTDSQLDFSLHLHLPENKKYLLYTQAQKALSPSQKERLTAKKIKQLYSPISFEREYKKFMAEKHVRELYEHMKKASSV